MQYQLSFLPPSKQRCHTLILGLYSDQRKLTGPAAELDRATKGLLSGLVRKGGPDFHRGQVVPLYQAPGVKAKVILLVGLGPEATLSPANFRRVLATATQAALEQEGPQLCNYLTTLKSPTDTPSRVKQALLTTASVLYRFDEYKSNPDEKGAARLRLVLFALDKRSGTATAQRALREAQATAEGMDLARNLSNQPPNVCTPAYLARTAQRLRTSHGLKVRVLEQAAMKKLGMGALLAVSQGSRQKPRFIILEHQGRKGGKGGKRMAPIVLVGKGVTFDTGGISLKPSAAMDEMKYDMCGGASVIGALAAAARLKLPRPVVGLVPAVENMPGGAAARPGDIVTSLSGKSIEILNTDAEGRLILCDALSYAQRYKPSRIVDVATLTGACVVALGNQASGLLSNEDTLAQELLDAGESSGDRAWRLPLWEEYQEQLRSPFADIANIGGRAAGTITAACFLSRFTEGQKWAHLDIAGTAWHSGKNKGASGRPVPLLVQFLLDTHS